MHSGVRRSPGAESSYDVRKSHRIDLGFRVDYVEKAIVFFLAAAAGFVRVQRITVIDSRRCREIIY